MSAPAWRNWNRVLIPLSLGEAIMNSLILTRSFMSAVEGSGPKAIPDRLIKEAENMYVKSPCPMENQLVSLYTPSLMEIVEHMSPDLKPNLFTAHRHLVHFEAAYRNTLECTTARLYGLFSKWKCRASIHCI